MDLHLVTVFLLVSFSPASFTAAPLPSAYQPPTHHTTTIPIPYSLLRSPASTLPHRRLLSHSPPPFHPFLAAHNTLPSTLRQEDACSITVSPDTTVRKLLQINGTVDDVLHFAVCPVSPASPLPDVTFQSSSSSGEVLQVDGDPDASGVELQFVRGETCINVTASFSFDAMVGITLYTLWVLHVDTFEPLCLSSIQFVITGMTVFETTAAMVRPLSRHLLHVSRARVVNSDTDPSLLYTIYSGVDNALVIDYRDALSYSIRDLRVRIQFPDGSDSMTRSATAVATAMQGVATHASVDASSPIRFDRDECARVREDVGVVRGGGEDGDDVRCGAVLATERGNVTFAVRLEPYKDGETSFLFDWPSLTMGDAELAGEMFETVMLLNVTGDPPPVVEDISVPEALHRAGGQEVTVVFDNVERSRERVLKVGDFEFTEVPGSFRRMDNGLYEAKFFTAKGNGTEIPWEVEVEYEEKGESSSNISRPGVVESLSYVTKPLEIGSLVPPWGVHTEQITLEGYFDGFDIEKDGHTIFIGEKSIEELGITTSFDERLNRIVLTAPSRSVAGSAYNYPIRVVVNEEETNAEVFSYLPDTLWVTIDVLGGSEDAATGVFVVGGCETSQFTARLPSGVTDPATFTWSVGFVDEDGGAPGSVDSEEGSNILSELSGGGSRTLKLPPLLFRRRTGIVEVSVACEVFDRNLSASVHVRMTNLPVIGVSLHSLFSRSLALPDLPVRVDAIVALPEQGCYDSLSAVVYDWNYGDVRRVFSSTDDAIPYGEDDIRPGRLGREFIIPQSKLRYGSHRVSLLVYLRDDPLIAGNASSLLVVQPADLVPVIGTGALRLSHGLSTDLLMTANRSVNPDAVYDQSGAISRYEWFCELRTTQDKAGPGQTCPSELLPSKSVSSFVVSSLTLRRVRERLLPNDESSSVHVTYSLSVGTSSLTSSRTSQTVELVVTASRLPALTSLSIENGRGVLVNWQRVRFYDDILIVPYASRTTWSFSVLAPVVDANLFKLRENLITHDGLYDPLGDPTQSSPLGIKAGSLRPAEVYDIAIFLTSGDGKSRKHALIVLRIQTVDRPRLVLPSLVIDSGDTDTLFSASAQVNLDSESDFLYYFFLIADDGEEMCIDGCSGGSTVQFRIPEVGTFRILVRLRDIQGTFVLDEQFFESNLSVANATEALSVRSVAVSFSSIDASLRKSFRFGDHGTVELLASSLARKIRRQGQDQAQSVDPLPVLNLAIGYFRRIVSNSVPTALTARSYIQTANQFVRLSTTLFSVSESLSLLDIVDLSLGHVPVAEAIDVRQELLLFYNLTSRHALRPFFDITFGNISSPPAVALGDGNETLGGNHSANASFSKQRSFLVYFFSMMQKHLSLVLSRDALCGTTHRVDTIVPRGSPLFDVAPEENSTSTFLRNNVFSTVYETLSSSSFSTFSLVVSCDTTPVQSMNGFAARFSWCNPSVGVEESDYFGDVEETPVETPSEWQDPVIQFGWLPLSDSMSIVPQRVVNSSSISVNTPATVAHNLSRPSMVPVKNIFVLLESIDYPWLSGMTKESKGPAPLLFTSNATVVSGSQVDLLRSATRDCFNINMSIPRLGRTVARGCLGVSGSLGKTIVGEDQGRHDWQMLWSTSSVEASLSVDDSSSVIIQSADVGVIRAVLNHCPVDLVMPSVPLPEQPDEFVFSLVSAAVGVSSAVTVAWVGSTASYATFSTAAAAV